MLSKKQVKLIRSLSQKKIRRELGLFSVEGVKGVSEFLNSDFELYELFATKDIFDELKFKSSLISESELKKISALKTPNKVLGVFKIPAIVSPPNSGLIVALDDIRDPGNLGTIIRLCDWFGVEHIVCSENSVDCYNFKVVQASMGSLTRVKVHYLNLNTYLKKQTLTLYGTDMEGMPVYDASLDKEGIIVFGNEANGMSEDIKELMDKTLTIPQFGQQQETESLNVANAAAIILSEFKRRFIEM